MSKLIQVEDETAGDIQAYFDRWMDVLGGLWTFFWCFVFIAATALVVMAVLKWSWDVLNR